MPKARADLEELLTESSPTRGGNRHPLHVARGKFRPRSL